MLTAKHNFLFRPIISDDSASNENLKPPTWSTASVLTVVAAIGYWIAFSTQSGAAAIFIALPCVCRLARLRTTRRAFYWGLATGMLMYAPPLRFFWSIFGPLAILLWMVTGFPIGAFLMLLNLAHRRLGSTWAMWLTPMLWTGIEYFRSEVWQLKFAWLLPGQAAAFLPGVRLLAVGVYGLGFIYVLTAALIADGRKLYVAAGSLAALTLAVLMYVPAFPAPEGVSAKETTLFVAGVQLEEPTVQQAVDALDHLALTHPEARILVLSEYTFGDTVPKSVRDVVRRYHRYLVAGGVRWTTGGKFYDAAFVIDPDGRTIFEQDKSVPVQFMDDGLPATGRKVWNSPWGKIGIGICYDLSYAKVMDDFVRQGAQGLIVPTMDPIHWGEYERRMLHGRLAPVRSAEYGIPIFGVWSSGVSQLTDRFGRVIATAEFGGRGEVIAGPFDLQGAGRIPPDRFLAIGATAGTAIFIVYLFARGRGNKWHRKIQSSLDPAAAANH
jgi:apolipoprotein N-acyltransferase